MRISRDRLSQIIAEEYSRAKRNRLNEGTQYNPIQLNPQALRQMIMQEARKIEEERLLESNSYRKNVIKLDAQSLRQMIMQEAKRYN
jgi:hypothetical protein